MIKTKCLSKSYGNGTQAIQNINLNIGRGEITAVIGRNGAGKSTLFKIFCGLIEDYSGECFVFERPSSIQMTEKISYIPEVRGLDPRMYVLSHLTDLVRYKGLGRKEAQNAVTEWLEKFELTKYRFQKIGSLSKGNQQKLQLIVALASNPELLILDEPFSGLDLITMDWFWDTLIALKEKGCTIIFSTHDLSENLLKSDQYIFMHQGQLTQRGTLEQIQNRYDLVLELNNRSAEQSVLERLAGAGNVLFQNNEFHIRLKNKEMAKVIFDALEEKFSEKFYLRHMTITEIFRETCR